jgi:hypothetical protein
MRKWILAPVRRAAEAYGILQLFSALGITAVTASVLIAFMEALRTNLNWFGQAILSIGLFLIVAVIVCLVSPLVKAHIPLLLRKSGIAEQNGAVDDFQEQKLATWLYQAIKNDPEHLDLRIRFRGPLVYWHGVGKLEPSLEFRMYIANRTKFLITIEQQASNGYMHYQGQARRQRAELHKGLKLTHALEDTLIITQPISNGLIQDLSKHLGDQVLFDLGNLRFAVKAHFPDDSLGPQSTLQLPNPWKVTVPVKSEWETYFETSAS